MGGEESRSVCGFWSGIEVSRRRGESEWCEAFLGLGIGVWVFGVLYFMCMACGGRSVVGNNTAYG